MSRAQRRCNLNNQNHKEKGDNCKTRAIKFIDRGNKSSIIDIIAVNTRDVGDFVGHVTGLRYNPLVNFPARVERFNV